MTHPRVLKFHNNKYYCWMENLMICKNLTSQTIPIVRYTLKIIINKESGVYKLTRILSSSRAVYSEDEQFATFGVPH